MQFQYAHAHDDIGNDRHFVLVSFMILGFITCHTILFSSFKVTPLPI